MQILSPSRKKEKKGRNKGKILRKNCRKLEEGRRKKLGTTERLYQRDCTRVRALCGVISINNALGMKLLVREEVDLMVKKLPRVCGDEEELASASAHCNRKAWAYVSVVVSATRQ